MSSKKPVQGEPELVFLGGGAKGLKGYFALGFVSFAY